MRPSPNATAEELRLVRLAVVGPAAPHVRVIVDKIVRRADPHICSAADTIRGGLPGPKIAVFWLLSALRAHTKAPYKTYLLWETLRVLNAVNLTRADRGLSSLCSSRGRGRALGASRGRVCH
jgi:hypothetical protein